MVPISFSLSLCVQCLRENLEIDYYRCNIHPLDGIDEKNGIKSDTVGRECCSVSD